MTDQDNGKWMLELANNVLERIARSEPLQETLTHVVVELEALNPDMVCSILLLDEAGTHLGLGAGPSVPKAFSQAIDGVAIGPGVGSCGTAAFTGQEVSVVDISSDPLWKDYAALALENGLQACWSSPLLSSARRVLGTFAVYYRTPRTATKSEREQIASVTNLVAIAIERDRESASLAASLAELKRWYEATLGRESRVLELKKEVNALLARLGESPRYLNAGDDEGSATPKSDHLSIAAIVRADGRDSRGEA
ncbi:GAF domain-containing protein [Azoarcus sp. L1K30]|uniref:GAF domain-containing protein n=1 Tax=Azoarcus sp. L1K30 TaxID=2820277 RepID=UPI001B81833E|nr:GAF domain-containing protein [Azoarcus sp. L1K30]MBR0566760.1 GAF domain-containing protein [Azoarcus sp. L1K30]